MTVEGRHFGGTTITKRDYSDGSLLNYFVVTRRYDAYKEKRTRMSDRVGSTSMMGGRMN